MAITLHTTNPSYIIDVATKYNVFNLQHLNKFREIILSSLTGDQKSNKVQKKKDFDCKFDKY